MVQNAYMPPCERTRAAGDPATTSQLPSCASSNSSLTWQSNFTTHKRMCLTSFSPLTFHFLPKRQRRKKKSVCEGGGGLGGEPDGGKGERGRREERKNGGPVSSSSFSLHISSLSLFTFSPSVSGRGNLMASLLPRRASSWSTSLTTGAAFQLWLTNLNGAEVVSGVK